MTKLIPQCTNTFFLDIFLCIPSKLREWKKFPSTLLAIVISLDYDVSRQKQFASRIMSFKNCFLEPPRWLGTCLNYRENDPIACFICKCISGVKSSLLCDLKILIKDCNLKYTGVSRGWKRRVCSSGVLQGRKLESNLQEHTVSIKK